MITIGSTGDVMPYIYLGTELKKRGYDITMCSFSNFENVILENGFKFAEIDSDAVNFMRQIMQSNKGGINYLINVDKEIKNIGINILDSVDRAARGADAIISVFFGSLSRKIAEKYKIKYVQTHFYPMDENDVAPIATVKMYAGGKVWYHMSYKIAYLILSSYENIRLSKWRKKYKLSKGKVLTKPDYTIDGKKFPVIYAISDTVFPKQDYWDDNIYVTGYFTSQDAVDYTPEQGLLDFLKNNPKVVYIGFGSMVSDNLNKYMNMVLEALKDTGIAAIITQGWGEIPNVEGSNIYITKAIPHEWLFDKVYAVVHHGGAGTFAAGLRHGKPTLVIPFGGDQSFSAQRAYRLGIGPKPIDSEKLTAQKLASNLIELVNNENYKINAEEIAVKVKEENGVVTAANIIEEYFSKV